MYKPYEVEVYGPPAVDGAGRVLLKAADLIRERGHAKEVFENGAGNLCLHGAINKAVTGNPYYMSGDDPIWVEATERVAGMLFERVYPGAESRAFTDFSGHWASRWNNAPERSADEVIAALTEAAYLVPA